jgi:cytochrome c peroxidase
VRNVARRPALMHNGFFTNLRDVVAFYATRDSNPARWYPAGMKFDDLPALHRGNVDVTIVPYVPAAGFHRDPYRARDRRDHGFPRHAQRRLRPVAHPKSMTE